MDSPSDAAEVISSPIEALAGTWQSKVLHETCRMNGIGVLGPMDKLGSVLLSMFAHNLDAGPLAVLLAAVFPGFYSIGTPFICSAAKIDKAGRIVADVVMRDKEFPRKDHVLFLSTQHLERTFRRLADRLKLSDRDRVALFIAAKAWVVADRRLDPAMDPADPDARRLVLH